MSSTASDSVMSRPGRLGRVGGVGTGVADTSLSSQSPHKRYRMRAPQTKSCQDRRMENVRKREELDRNLALELVRVTEAAAMAAGRWVGRGDKNGGDGAAVDAMRKLINSVSMQGVMVIGEGEKDQAPMLFNGEQVGDGTGAECDVAVDPIDGTTLMSKGMPNAISVMAVADRGAMYDPSAVFYMEKIPTGPEAPAALDLTVPVAENT